MGVRMRVKLEFTEEMLGTACGDPEIHSKFIASKAEGNTPAERDAKIAEEIEALGLEGAEENHRTVFPKLEDGTPFIYDYQIRGFFKETASALRKDEDAPHTNKLTAHIKAIERLVYVEERKIPLIIPEGGEMGLCQRPLRGKTPRGERVTLACSETVPEGTTCEFTIYMKNKTIVPCVKEWLDNGIWTGLGQWRSSGKGRFECQYRILP